MRVAEAWARYASRVELTRGCGAAENAATGKRLASREPASTATRYCRKGSAGALLFVTIHAAKGRAGQNRPYKRLSP